MPDGPFLDIGQPLGPSFDPENRFAGRLQAMPAQIAGVDEVGRGPLAGPVVAAAVILDADAVPDGLADSKKLSAKKRQALAVEIRKSALAVSIASASVEEIDSLNILAASLLAMRRAIAGLAVVPLGVLVDGNQHPGCDLACQTLVKGDARSLSVAAASIVAKVFRDDLMGELAQKYPAYGWERNAGYGVPHHLRALDMVGACPHHRKSFAPIRDVLSKQQAISR